MIIILNKGIDKQTWYAIIHKENDSYSQLTNGSKLKSMCRSKETPCGYPLMHKGHVQIKERSDHRWHWL